MKERDSLVHLIVSHRKNPALRVRYDLNNWKKEINDSELVKLLHLKIAQKICRTDVLNYYLSEEDSVRKFILSMFWGGIRNNFLKSIISENKEELARKIYTIEGVLKSKKAEVIDSYLEVNSGIHVWGVGLSFITKHLYFADQGKNFFIYDKWTKKFHYAYMLEFDRKRVKDFFCDFDSIEYSSDLRIKKGMHGEAYFHFCHSLRHIFQKVNKKLEKAEQFREVGELEAFVFGEGGRAKKESRTNPRHWILDYIKQNK